MRRALTASLVSLALVAGACGSGNDDTATTSTSGSTTTTTETTTETAASAPTEAAPAPDPEQLETVVSGLEVPWGVAFVDADTVLVTERSGRVRVVEDGRLRDAPAAEVDVAARGEGGLLGIALHPDFPEERWAYLYATTDEGNEVSRWAVGEDLAFSDPEVLLGGIPSARIHDGGRIAFGPDGMLYVAAGDASEPSVAADLDVLAGKILRIAADGSVPGDNPFDGSPVWSYGHRNPQGLAWDADGRMYASEHGPSGEFGLCCNDEINRIEPGGFYGWPFASGTQDTGADGDPPAEMIPPVATSGADATWAPAGLAVLGSGDDASIVLATLRAEALLQFPISADGTVGAPETVRDDLGRLRPVALDPDGCLWVGTSNRDGRGDPAGEDDRLLRAC